MTDDDPHLSRRSIPVLRVVGAGIYLGRKHGADRMPHL